RFDAAFEGDAMRTRQQVQTLLIPQVDACLKPDGDRPLGDLFQQPAYRFAYPENLIDEVDVVDSPRNQLINFGDDCLESSLPILVPEQRLVAEGAGVGAPARELHLGATHQVVRTVAGENVV